MEEINKKNTEDMEIDLQRLFGALMNKAWLIAIVAVVLGIVLFFILRRYSLSLPKTLFVAVKDGAENAEESEEDAEAEEATVESIEEDADGTAD